MIVAVTGLPGSGKSFFCSALRRCGALFWDADVLGHGVLKDPKVISALIAAFGCEMLTEEGAISREALGALVFGKADFCKVLNEICHPAIRRHLEEHLAQVPKGNYGVFEAALLWEAGFGDLCDISVVVDTSFDLRLERVAGRGWGKEQLINRDRAQDASLKLSRSDLCLDGQLSEDRLWSFTVGFDVAMRYALAVGNSQRAIDLLKYKTEIKKI